jgi:hypothetical protein
VTQDARALHDAHLDRIAAARDAASHAPAVNLVDVAGCFAEQRRDLWIFRGDRFLAHVPHALIDAMEDRLLLGELKIALDGSIDAGGDEFDFLLDGVPHSLNAADDFGAGYDALEEIGRLLDAPGVVDVLVSINGGDPVRVPRTGIATRGTDVPALAIAALGVSIPFHEIGHRGLVRRGRDLTILGLGGTTIAMTPVAG